MRSDVTTGPGPSSVSCVSCLSFIHIRQMCRFFTFHYCYDLPFSAGLNVAVATAGAGVCYGEHCEAW